MVWPEAVDFRGFPTQQDEIGYSPALNDKVPGEGFSNFNEADTLSTFILLSSLKRSFNRSQHSVNYNMKEESDAAVQKPQLATDALNKDHQMANNLVISWKLTSSWTCAWNLSIRCMLSWHNTRMCTEVGKTKITFFFIQSSVFPSVILSYNITLTTFSQEHYHSNKKQTHIVLCLLIIYTVSCFMYPRFP